MIELVKVARHEEAPILLQRRSFDSFEELAKKKVMLDLRLLRPPSTTR